MSITVMNIKKELRDMKSDIGLIQKIDCSDEDNKKYSELVKSGGSLPEGVYRYTLDGKEIDEFYTVYEPDLTFEEIEQYVLLKQYERLCSIKSYLLFFVVLTVISIIGTVLALAFN